MELYSQRLTFTIKYRMYERKFLKEGAFSMTNPVLLYPGGKYKIRDWICSYIPPHRSYLEPFCGGASIFFAKSPCELEILNDINGDICNFFRVLRDQGEELAKKIFLTPYSREEYENAYIPSSEDTELERARKFCIKCNLSFAGGNRYKTGFRIGRADNWNQLPETIIEAAKRIKQAQIESMPAIELIKKYQNSETFIYLDPPYYFQNSTDKYQYLYKHILKPEEHEEMLKILVESPAKILLSGYENSLYEKYLEKNGWKKKKKIAVANKGGYREETLWMNYEICEQLRLF